jgi:hypothetical protein
MNPISLEGEFVRLEPLTLAHLPDLEIDFEPKLFDYYPKPYATAREFVEENLQMQKTGTFLPFAIIRKDRAIGCTEFSADAYYSIIAQEWPEAKERLLQKIQRKAKLTNL